MHALRLSSLLDSTTCSQRLLLDICLPSLPIQCPSSPSKCPSSPSSPSFSPFCCPPLPAAVALLYHVDARAADLLMKSVTAASRRCPASAFAGTIMNAGGRGRAGQGSAGQGRVGQGRAGRVRQAGGQAGLWGVGCLSGSLNWSNVALLAWAPVP